MVNQNGLRAAVPSLMRVTQHVDTQHASHHQFSPLTFPLPIPFTGNILDRVQQLCLRHQVSRAGLQTRQALATAESPGRRQRVILRE